MEKTLMAPRLNLTGSQFSVANQWKRKRIHTILNTITHSNSPNIKEKTSR